MTRPRIFYGWWVTGAFAAMVFTSAGIRHAVGPFLKPMVADLGVDRASFSLVIALGLLLYGVFQPWTSALVDRIGVRAVTVGGTVLLAAALALTSRCQNLWQLALVYSVIGSLALSATGPVMASSVVSRWFHRRRGTALSVLGSASGTGMSLLVPGATWLILTVGWRQTFLVMAAGVLVLMLPLCLFVLRDSPESIGLRPDGDSAQRVGSGSMVERTSITAAVQTLAFWQLAGSFLTCGFSMSLLASHGMPMLTDHGYTPMLASWALSLFGASSIGFTMLLGIVADRYGRRPVLSAVYGGRAFVFAGLFLIRDNPAALLAVAIVGGVTMAGTMSMTSALTADIYGRFSVGPVLGVIFLVHQTGSAVGASLAGVLFETTGGYGAAFVLACTLLVAAALVSIRIDDGSRVLRVRPARA
jgi:MFS family permease